MSNPEFDRKKILHKARADDPEFDALMKMIEAIPEIPASEQQEVASRAQDELGGAGSHVEAIGRLIYRMWLVCQKCEPIYSYYHGRNSLHAIARLLRLAPKPDFKKHKAELDHLRNSARAIVAEVAKHRQSVAATPIDAASMEAVTAECQQVHYDGVMVIAFADWVDAMDQHDAGKAAEYTALWWELAGESKANHRRVQRIRRGAGLGQKR